MKTGMLIGTDILGPERVAVDVPQRVAVIGSCKDVRMPITVTPRARNQMTLLLAAKGEEGYSS